MLLFIIMDINYYKKFNNDLKNFNDKQLINHYNRYGKNENRITCKKDFYKKFNYFDCVYYKNKYDDLKNFTDIELEYHFYHYGNKDNRICCEKIEKLDILFYKNFHSDLQNLDNTQLKNHYINYGINENRYINKIDYFINEKCKFLSNFEVNFRNKFETWEKYLLNREECDNYYNNYNTNLLKDYYDYDYYNIIEKKNRLDMNTNIKSIIKTNEILYNNLNNNKFLFKDLIDNNFYEVFNITYSDTTIIFYCRIDDPFFLIQNWIYSDFFYYGNIKTRKLIQITHSTAGNDFIFNFIPDMIYNINYNYKIENKKYLLFGFLNNVGHHLWQEITGLINFLNNKENYNKIDGIIIGNYDYFNIKKLLNEKYNFKIINNINLYENNINLNFYPLFLRSFYIDHKYTISFFNNLLNIDINLVENIIQSDLHVSNELLYEQSLLKFPEKKNIELLTIVLDIRTNSRKLISIKDFYIYFINQLYDSYSNKYKIKIIFTGRFLTRLNDINLDNDNEYLEQTNIVNDIIKSINSENILFYNLIGKEFFYIIKHSINSDIFIGTGGTSYISLINWIYNKKGLYFFNSKLIKLYSEIQFVVLNNYNAYFTPKEYIIDKDNYDFDIHYDLFFNYFIKMFDLIINY